MRKQDLYSGDIVQLRNGETYIVLKNTRYGEEIDDLFISLKNGSSCPLNKYDDNLRFKCEIRAGDIMKVCAYDYAGKNIQKHIINNSDSWTWEREAYKTTIEWHDVRDKLPSTSGHYLCNTHNGEMLNLSYSSVYEMFNTNDFFNNKEAASNAIKVTYWAEIPILEVNDDEEIY